ncbi:cell division protein FtsL [Limosilactobacillus gorillae]|uniref:cell division protein FtsL n=1 Tax=Limosilactobacillus gorillae TaxID=1450649 RepID=UPI000B15A9B4|nr:septum formation initiator family protein [Limosilactobacillus gorillae]
MASNTAQQLTNPAQDPAQQIQPSPAPQPQSKRVPLSTFEKLTIALACVLVIGLTISLVSTKIQTTSRQQVLQTIQQKIATQTSQNTSQRQQIGELTSQDHLKKVAKKYGLTDSNASVRNVNK